MPKKSPTLPLKDSGGDPGTPRALLPKGSPEWCYRTVDRLRWALEEVHVTEAEYNKVLRELEEHRAWEKIPSLDHPYGSLDALLAGELGVSRDEASAKKVRQQAIVAKPLNPNGVKSDDRCSLDNIKGQPSKGGTSADYLTARIARDNPEILDRMKAGEFKSVRKAAIEAGIVKPTLTIPLVAANAARLIAKHFAPDALEALLRDLAIRAGFTLTPIDRGNQR